MSKLKTFIAQVEKFDHECRGISRVDGKTVFIDGALPDESVEAIVTRRKSNFAEARVSKVLAPSADRVLPPCAHHDVCGGCRLQHIPSAMQIQMKQDILAEHLQHLAQASPRQWLEPITANPWGYRRKARLGVRKVKHKGLLIGFREKYSKQYIANIEKCLILDKRIGERLPELSQCIDSLSINHAIPQIEVAASAKVMALIIRHLQPLTDDDKKILIDFAQSHQFHIYTQSKGLDTIKILTPEDAEPLLDYDLEDHGLNLQFKPCDFVQVNAEINRKMINLALDELEIEKSDNILDLFCGIGNFSLPMARFAKSVTGIEYEETMVQRAEHNAARNNIENTEFYAADLSQIFGGVTWFKRHYDKILLDPPRSGALEIIKQFPQFHAKKIVYISCNPTTLARDTGELIRQDYQLIKSGVMDMFPHTRHVEAIAVFEKR